MESRIFRYCEEDPRMYGSYVAFIAEKQILLNTAFVLID